MVHFGLKVLFAASILYIVHPAESITCFQCKEEDDLRCATNVTTQMNFINQCGAIGSEGALITKPTEVTSPNSKCLKAVLRLRGGGKTVLRTCVHDSATCESIMSNFPPEKMQLQECAFCKDRDLCNSGTSITVALSVLGISSLIHYLLK